MEEVVGSISTRSTKQILKGLAHRVASNSSALPEVVGNSAVMVNPENGFEVSRALHRVLTDHYIDNMAKYAIMAP
jgi:hypothetical protein